MTISFFSSASNAAIQKGLKTSALLTITAGIITLIMRTQKEERTPNSTPLDNLTQLMAILPEHQKITEKNTNEVRLPFQNI